MTEETVYKNLENRWSSLPLASQLANIGSEVSRMFHWKKKENHGASLESFFRALELLDFSIADPRWRGKRRELTRLREIVCDRGVDAHEYDISEESLQKYFLDFAFLARNIKK